MSMTERELKITLRMPLRQIGILFGKKMSSQFILIYLIYHVEQTLFRKFIFATNDQKELFMQLE